MKENIYTIIHIIENYHGDYNVNTVSYANKDDALICFSNYLNEDVKDAFKRENIEEIGDLSLSQCKELDIYNMYKTVFIMKEKNEEFLNSLENDLWINETLYSFGDNGDSYTCYLLESELFKNNIQNTEGFS